MTKAIIIGISQMVTGQRDVSEIGGPVKIAQYTAASAKKGVINFLWFVALISLQLGLLNLLPIPGLDGSHLVMYLVEAIIRRPVPQKIQEILFKFGWVILISLMIFCIV